MNPNRSSWALALALVPGALACASSNGGAPPKSAASAPAETEASDKKTGGDLTAWLDEKYEESLLRFSPMELTMLGRKERNDELGSFTRADSAEQVAWRKSTVEEMERRFDYAALSPLEQVSYDVWKYQYEQAKAALPYFHDGYVFHQMSGPQSFLPTFLINFHRVEGKADLEAYVSRLEEVERAMGELLTVARTGTTKGVRYPKFALEGVIDQAGKVITGAPFGEGEPSDLWADVQSETKKLLDAEKITEAEAEALEASARAALVEKVQPAYEALIAWAEEELERSPEVATGVGARPGGDAYYAHALKSQTTTDLTPDEIHELGLAEVARLRSEMEEIKDEVKFDGTLDEFFEHVRNAEWNYYPDTDEGRKAYITDAKAAIDNIEQHLPRFFNLRPKARLVVKRVEPFREQDGAAQHYYPSTPDGSRPGTYYAHLSDMTAMPKNQLEVIAYHEGIPGHHMQIAIAQELEGVPKFRTQAFFGVYAEGWALYAEKLAKEMPETYEDPYSRLGRLTSEAWRAIRLVVDTGLHAKGWTEQEAIDYFIENSPEPLESVTSEIRRYIVWPGQATTYKIGMQKILELRRDAEERLGERFDIRGFHDAVLGGGSVPLDILERQVESWVQSVERAPAS